MALLTATDSGSGSSGRIVGAEKHEIYGTAFGGHLFYDIFTGPGGGHIPRGPPGSATGVGGANAKSRGKGCQPIILLILPKTAYNFFLKIGSRGRVPSIPPLGPANDLLGSCVDPIIDINITLTSGVDP